MKGPHLEEVHAYLPLETAAWFDRLVSTVRLLTARRKLSRSAVLRAVLRAHAEDFIHCPSLAGTLARLAAKDTVRKGPKRKALPAPLFERRTGAPAESDPTEAPRQSQPRKEPP